jgi:geranylgeranyl reductase family protein
MDTEYDLIVVGAGPAGSSCARAASELGLAVLVLESSSFPRSKPCAAGLSQRSLDRLGPRISDIVHQTCSVVEVRLGLGTRLVWEAEAGLVATTTRRELDSVLAQAAVDAGARVEFGCSAESVAEDGAGVTLTAGSRKWRGAHLVAADGARGGGWLGRRPGAHRLSGAAYVRAFPAGSELLDAYASRVTFDLTAQRRGYGWVFPKRDHLNVGVYSQRPLGKDLIRDLDSFIERAGLEGWRREGPFAHAVPSCPRRPRLAAGRTMFVGDAAGLADPITGEGICHAIASGRAAARAIAGARGAPDQARTIYRELISTEVGPQIGALRRAGNLVYTIGPGTVARAARVRIVQQLLKRYRSAAHPEAATLRVVTDTPSSY